MTTEIIARILELLKDGKWHTLQEIQQRTKVDKDQIYRITDFLEKYSFIVADDMEKKVRLDKIVRKFWTKTTTS